MNKCLLIILTFFSIMFSYASDLEYLEEENSIRLEKITDYSQLQMISDGEDIDENILNTFRSTFSCNLYGTYIVKENDTNIGIFSISNGAGTYYEDKAECLGFTDGSWAEISIFLNPQHVGKGYFSRVNEKIIELISPYIGRHHVMPSLDAALLLSQSPFKGIRGVIDSGNIISLRAALKNGRCLIDIEEMRGNWITQYPTKEEFTDIEIKIKDAAELIIAETLDSFRSVVVEAGTIASTQAARDSVSKHYATIFKA